MKESIGGIQLFLIVVILVLVFAGIMSLTINQSNAFAIKDQLVSILESAGGFDTSAECVNGSCNTSLKDQETLQKIIDSLDSNSYRQTGSCEAIEDSLNEKAVVVGYTRTGEKTISGRKDSFCIAKIPAQKTNSEDTLKGYYYQIYVFYQLDIPILNSLFNFRAIGETKLLYR